MGRKVTHNMAFTEASYRKMKQFSELLGFGSVAGFVQAAVIEYITNRIGLIERFENEEASFDRDS